MNQSENPEGTEAETETEAVAELIEEDPRSPSTIEAEEKEAARFQSKKKKTGAKPELEADFFYEYETIFSKPVISEQAENLPENLLQLLLAFLIHDKNLHLNLNFFIF